MNFSAGRKTLRTTSRRLIRQLGWRLGLDIRRLRADVSIEVRRQHFISRAGVSLVLDVGANTGQYAELIRSNGYRGDICSFEPLEEPFQRLQEKASKDAHWQCLRIALGSKSGHTEMNVAANLASSSLLPMTEAHLRAEPNSRYTRREPVDIATLDQVASRLQLSPVATLIKIDTQGYEMEVLQGARELLEQVVLVEVEMSLVELYDGQATSKSLWTYLEHLGFELVAVHPGFSDPTSGRMLQMDGMFLRCESALRHDETKNRWMTSRLGRP